MNLHGENTLESTAFRVEIDEVGGGMSVDPVAVMIPLDENPVFVPLIGSEGLFLHCSDVPWLPLGIHDDFFPGV